VKPPPIMTPQQRRDILIGSYLDSYRRAQIKATPAEVERQVVADCELVDAAGRAGELTGFRPGKPQEQVSRTRPDAIAEAARANGLRLTEPTEQPQIWRPSFLFKNPQQVSERWGYATARIARILEGGTTGTALAPLARDFHTLWACFLMRDIAPERRGFERNEFDGLSDRDVGRAFMRAIEDICDRSTGVLGSWYVK
jgi:hypothetical protein